MFPYKELLENLELDFARQGITGTGPMSSDMDLRTVRSLALRASIFKKLSPGGVSAAAQESALKKFSEINASISTDPYEFGPESEVESVFWDYFKDNLQKALRPSDVDLDLEFVRETFAAGPGAALGCDNESFYTKLFASRISVTSPYLLSLYRAMIVESDSWAMAELARHKKFGEEIVAGNRLFFVEKTTEIARTCCTEPMANMLVQKGIGTFIERCLERSFGVNLTTQPDFNRELARVGSIDGSFGTIDLQSASDSISWELVKRVVPANLLGWLRVARSEETILPDGSRVPLRMISTMGNGFTFPLQTIIFACVVRSVYQMMGLASFCPKTQFGVFGDDIIVRREAYSFVCQMLQKLGFRVNDSKSFNTGMFRESCGYDWWNGAFIRGVYLVSLEDTSDVYSAINRLNRWSAVSGVNLSSTIGFLLSKCKKPLLVPFSESVDSGYQVPFNMTKPRVTDSYWFAYRKLVRTKKTRKVPGTIEESRDFNYRFFNTDGWAVTFLGGYARNTEMCYKPDASGELDLSMFGKCSGQLTLRSPGGKLPCKVIRCSIPYWDWVGFDKAPILDKSVSQARPGVMNQGYTSDAYETRPLAFMSYRVWSDAVAGNS